MKKIPTVFCRNFETDRLVRDEVVPGCEWVFRGEGVATKKFDGTPVMVRDGKMLKRFDAKKDRVPPRGFEPAMKKDEETGHWAGWVPVGDGPEDKLFREVFSKYGGLENGTYELCGPKVNKNPEGFVEHDFIPHGQHPIEDFPLGFEEMKSYLGNCDIEGVVWHHPDGRMAKIKGKDFGIKRQEVKNANRNA